MYPTLDVPSDVAVGSNSGWLFHWSLFVEQRMVLSLIWYISDEIRLLRYPSNQPVPHWLQGLYSLRRRRLTGIGIPIINLKRSDDRLRFIIGIPILIRRRLLSEYSLRRWGQWKLTNFLNWQCSVYKPCWNDTVVFTVYSVFLAWDSYSAISVIHNLTRHIARIRYLHMIFSKSHIQHDMKMIFKWFEIEWLRESIPCVSFLGKIHSENTRNKNTQQYTKTGFPRRLGSNPGP